MKTKLILAMTTLLAATMMAVPAAQAKQKGCGKKHKMPSLHEKFFHKAHFILKNGKELELTDAQISAIKKLKMEAKKFKIRKKADVKIIYVDILAELHNEKVNVEKTNQLIDQKYEVKKELAKGFIARYAELKSLLTDDQMKELKEIWMSGCGRKCKK